MLSQSSVEEKKAEADRLFEEGFERVKNGQFEVAIPFLERSMRLYEEINDRHRWGSSLLNLGTSYHSLGDYQKAIEYYQQSLEIRREIDITEEYSQENRHRIAISFMGLGITYLSLGDYQKAIENYKQSLQIFKEIGDRDGIAISLESMGSVYGSFGYHKKAIEYYKKSLEIYQNFGDQDDIANSLKNIGNSWESLGDYQKAIAFHRQSLEIYHKIENDNGVAISLGNLANAYWYLAEYQQALHLYKQSLEIFIETGKRDGIAGSIMGLGNAYNSIREYHKALELYQQSLEVYQEIGYRQGVATCSTNMGNTYRYLGNYQKAAELYQQSLEISRAIGYRRGVANSIMGLGLVLDSQGEPQKAIKLYQQSLTISQDINYLNGKINSYNNIGNSYLKLGEYKKAIEFHKKSLEIKQKISDVQGVADSLNNLGNSYYGMEDYQRAIEFYQKSLSVFQNIVDRQGIGNSLNNLGLAYRSLENLSESERVLKESIQVKETLRVGLSDPNKISIFDTQLNTYKILQNVLIRQNKTIEALEIADRSRSRALIDEIVKRTSDPDSENLVVPPLTLSEIKETARQNNAHLVVYSIIEDEFDTPETAREIKESELYIWVVTPDGEINFRSVDLKPLWQQQDKTIPEIVQNTLYSIATGDWYRGGERRLPQVGDWVRLKGDEDPEIAPSRIIEIDPETQTIIVTNSTYGWDGEEKPISDIVSYETSSVAHHEGLQQLHQLLIEPIADLLPQKESDRIIFIPEDSLLYVPWAALQDSRGNVLIQKHTISTAPSIQVLAVTPQNPLGNLTETDALIVGNPIMPKVVTTIGEPPEQLGDLPGSEREAQTIAQLLKTEAILGENATEVAVIEQMPRANIIHLATHGLIGDFTGGGIPGAIALSADPAASNPDIWGSDVGDGLLMAQEIFDLKLRANLVVLSACDTGRGRLTGDGVVGLSRSLMTAGASTVMVTLWKVDDEKTVALMSEFYRQLQRDPDKAKALRNAMLMMLDTHPKPEYWAAFTLIGAPE